MMALDKDADFVELGELIDEGEIDLDEPAARHEGRMAGGTVTWGRSTSKRNEEMRTRPRGAATREQAENAKKEFDEHKPAKAASAAPKPAEPAKKS